MTGSRHRSLEQKRCERILYAQAKTWRNFDPMILHLRVFSALLYVATGHGN